MLVTGGLTELIVGLIFSEVSVLGSEVNRVVPLGRLELATEELLRGFVVIRGGVEAEAEVVDDSFSGDTGLEVEVDGIGYVNVLVIEDIDVEVDILLVIVDDDVDGGNIIGSE